MSVYYKKTKNTITKKRLLRSKTRPANQGNYSLDRIIINSHSGFNVLELDEIISIQSMPGSYAFFYTTDNKQIICTKPLNYFEKQLPQFKFYRIHRSYIINLKHMVSFDSLKGEVIMIDQKKLSVAVRRRAKFLEVIKSSFV